VTFAEALTSSPLLFPIAIDPGADGVRLIRLTADDYKSASFLDNRLLTHDTPTAPASWTDVRAAAERLPLKCHFIFHISHVGSTLVSRLVGEHAALLSLREPAILRFLADAHFKIDEPESPWNRAEFEDRLRCHLALWSRTFERDETAVIKATSFVSEMAAHLLDRVSTARAVFMFVTPEIFLQALLGGAMSDIATSAERRLARLHRRLGEARWSLADLSPGERVAMSWLSEMSALQAAAEQFPARVLWLDFDRFLAEPEKDLAGALRHFGATDATSAARSILAGPIMHRYAKAPAQPFDATVRRHMLDQSAREHEAEIAKGLDWLCRALALRPLRGMIAHFAGNTRSFVPC
jgi:hypothetical protein